MLILRAFNRFVLISLALLGLSISSALAVVIDFESLHHADSNISGHGSSYGEDGFTIGGSILSTFGSLEFRYSGSTAMFENSGGFTNTLTQDNANPFSIHSIDLSELNGSFVASVAFTGLYNGGGSIQQTFTLDGVSFGAETFAFTGLWSNLDQVSWSQAAPFHQFDNIVLNAPSAVPVPAAVWLFGTALIGLVGFSKRREST